MKKKVEPATSFKELADGRYAVGVSSVHSDHQIEVQANKTDPENIKQTAITVIHQLAERTANWVTWQESASLGWWEVKYTVNSTPYNAQTTTQEVNEEMRVISGHNNLSLFRNNFYFKPTIPVVIGELKLADAGAYTTGGVVNQNTVKNVLPGQIGCDAAIATIIAPSLSDGRLRYDNVALWATGLSYCRTLHEFELRAEPVAQNTLKNGSLIYRNIATTTDQATVAAGIISDINDGTFVYLGSELSSDDVVVIAWMAQGVGSMRMDPGSTQSSHMEQYWVTELQSGFKSAIYWWDGRAPPTTLSTDITSGRFWASLWHLASLRGETDQLVAAMTTMSNWHNGIFDNIWYPQSGFWCGFNSMLECGYTVIPRPRDSNFLWRALAIGEPPQDSEIWAEDAATLSSCGVGEMVRISVILGMTLKGLAHMVFGYYNIGGHDIDNWLQGSENGRALGPLWQFMMTMHDPDQNTIVFPRFVCALASQMTDFTINPRGLYMGTWNNNGSANMWNAGYGPWGTSFGVYPPRDLDPLVLCPLWKGFCTQWGIPGGDVSVNWGNEIIPSGTGKGWYSENDTGEIWKKNLSEGLGMVYDPYALMLYNTINQCASAGTNPGNHVYLRVWQMSGDKVIFIEEQSREIDLTKFYPGFNWLRAYNWKTWDWETETAVQMYWKVEDIPANMRPFLDQGIEEFKLPAAGAVLPLVAETKLISPMRLKVLGMMNLGHSGKRNPKRGVDGLSKNFDEPLSKYPVVDAETKSEN
jgi:hypothetical protein